MPSCQLWEDPPLGETHNPVFTVLSWKVGAYVDCLFPLYVSPDWNHSLWSSKSSPGIFLVYVPGFLYRSEWAEFIVTQFRITHQSVVSAGTFICSILCMLEQLFSFLPAPAAPAVDGRWCKTSGCYWNTFLPDDFLSIQRKNCWTWQTSPVETSWRLG